MEENTTDVEVTVGPMATGIAIGIIAGGIIAAGCYKCGQWIGGKIADRQDRKALLKSDDESEA